MSYVERVSIKFRMVSAVKMDRARVGKMVRLVRVIS